MVDAGSFKNGLTIEIDGDVYQIIEFQHVKPGKGAAFVRTKLKNIISGGVVERTFRPTERFENAHIDRVDMQYLFDDGDMYKYRQNDEQDKVDEHNPPRYNLCYPRRTVYPYRSAGDAYSFISCVGRSGRGDNYV